MEPYLGLFWSVYTARKGRPEKPLSSLSTVPTPRARVKAVPLGPCHPIGDTRCSYLTKQSVVALCDRDTETYEQSRRGTTSVEQETAIKGF